MVNLETRLLRLRNKHAGIAVQLALKRLALANAFKYSPDQPRDDHGRWTSGGGADAAADYATAHANKGGATGQCAKYVRAALNDAGIPLTSPPARDGANAPWARDYGPQLEKVGFTPIVDEPGTNGFGATYPPTNYTPQKGDVAVMDPSSKSSPAGHIAIYNGNQWVSDFKQNRGANGMYPGKSYLSERPSYKIYRMSP